MATNNGWLDKEPAVLIGTVVTIILAVITTLSGNGFISDVVAGQATDIVNSIQQLLLLLAPIIAGGLIRGQVYSPATVEKIVEGDQDAGL